ALIHNAALLLAMIFIYDLSTRYWRAEHVKFWGWQLPAGVALGAITVVIMLTPWIYQPGIIFDTRTILLSIAGLFFGAVPTVIAMIIAAGFRVYTGGFAVVTGVLTIVSAGL